MSPRLSDLFLSSQSDERLVILARAGHERAFAAIVERYRPELYALARRLCSDGRGEDVVQQAFLSAFAALRSGAEVKHLRGWLFQIVRNAATRSRSPLCVPLDGATACAETLEDVVQQRALAMSALAELARLPARQRQAIVGTALDGMARAELASTMGVSEGAVRQLVHRARASLRTAVTALTPWPVARWFAVVRPVGPGAAELATGAGAASSGGIAFKLGALLASGTLVTGVAAVSLHPAPAHRSRARAATPTRTQPRAGRHGTLELAAVAPDSLGAAAAHPHRGRPQTAGSRRSAAPAGASGKRVELRGAPREDSTTTRQEGAGGGAGHGDRSGANRQGGDDRSSPAGQASGTPGGGGQALGSGHDGGGGTSGEASTATASGSGDNHGDQTVSGSPTLDAAVDGQSTGGGDSSGSDSGVSFGAGSTSSGSSGPGSGSGSTAGSSSGSGTDSTSGDAGASTGH